MVCLTCLEAHHRYSQEVCFLLGKFLKLEHRKQYLSEKIMMNI